MLDLLQTVIATVPAPTGTIEAHGIVIGRTYEEHPRYDLLLDDGQRVRNLAEEWLRAEA